MMVLEPPITDEIHAFADEARTRGILARQVPHKYQAHEYPEEG